MTLQEARAICEQVAWLRPVSPVRLFDELVQVADEPVERYDGSLGPGAVTSALAGYDTGQATGLVVSVVLSLRRKVGLDIYETKDQKATPQ